MVDWSLTIDEEFVCNLPEAIMTCNKTLRFSSFSSMHLCYKDDVPIIFLVDGTNFI